MPIGLPNPVDNRSAPPRNAARQSDTGNRLRRRRNLPVFQLRLNSKLQHYATLALEGGVQEARIIPAEYAKTAEWVRLKCQYGCSGYNQGLCCPPHAPTPEQTKRVIAEYRHALIYSYGLRINAPTRIRRSLRTLLVQLERTIFLDGYYKVFGFGSGPCRLCARCNTEKLCRFPDQARPSMEACGIDVYTTCRNAGIELHVVTEFDAPSKHINLILID
jgi:predicted metal-binding protein